MAMRADHPELPHAGARDRDGHRRSERRQGSSIGCRRDRTASGHADPRRRHRAGGVGGGPARCSTPRSPGSSWVERVAGVRGARGARRPPARGDARGDPRLEGRDQGTDHDARRLGVPQHQRRAPPGAGPVRGGPPGAIAAGRADASRARGPRGRPGEHRGPLPGGRVRGRVAPGRGVARGAARRWPASRSGRTRASP